MFSAIQFDAKVLRTSDDALFSSMELNATATLGRYAVVISNALHGHRFTFKTAPHYEALTGWTRLIYRSQFLLLVGFRRKDCHHDV